MTGKRWRYGGAKRRGAALVEMALIVPVFTLMMVFPMIEATRMCMVNQVLANAAREGCRVAASPGKAGDIIGDAANRARSRVNDTLDRGGIKKELVTTTLTPTSIETIYVPDNPSTDQNWIRVTVSVPFAKVNWYPYPFIYQNYTATATAAMRSQRPRP